MDIADQHPLSSCWSQVQPTGADQYCWMRVDDAEQEPRSLLARKYRWSTLAQSCASMMSALLAFSSDLVFEWGWFYPVRGSNPVRAPERL